MVDARVGDSDVLRGLQAEDALVGGIDRRGEFGWLLEHPFNGFVARARELGKDFPGSEEELADMFEVLGLTDSSRSPGLGP